MSTSRRRAKKSLLGTRVCAPWKDGFFYSGIIEAVKSKPAGENTYTILFDDGYIAEVDEEEIVGPGFANPGTVQLRRGQLVYVFFKGKEVAATVCKTDAEYGEVLVFPKHEHNKVVLAVKASEVHLTRGQQYSREEMLEKKISRSVFCPVPNKVKHGATKNSGTGRMEENIHRSEEMAALVLTALSISPVFNEKNEKSRFQLPPSPDSGSEIPFSFTPSNSPVGSMSPASATDEPKFPPVLTPPSPLDEGISVEIPRRETNRKRKCSWTSVRTLYQCTWPGCGKTLSTAPGIIRHVRTIHLGPKRHSEDGYSDGEEEFYFNEIEAEIDDGGEAFPYPSPIALSPTPTHSHFDMVKSPWSEPMAGESHVPHAHETFSFNWDGVHSTSALPFKPVLHPKPTPRTSHTHPQSFIHRKTRGENKKCRKVYGMDNRHLWCTQCRWKKACVRFLD